jgi:hypothetical protein
MRHLAVPLDTTPEMARLHGDVLRRRSMFNVIADGWKVDLIIRKDRPFDVEELLRRKPFPFAGAVLPFVTPEGTILSKLEWDRLSPSEQQVRNALHVAIM